MRRVFLPLMVLTLAARLATLSAPMAQAADPVVQRITFTNQVDPEASAQITAACRSPVVATTTGASNIITWTTPTSATRELQLQNYVTTYTNSATGTSVTVRLALQISTSVTTVPGMRVFTASLQGANFIYLQQGGAIVSAGRRDLVAIVTLDEQGHVTDVQVTFSDTPNLTGAGAFLCPRLAA